MKIAASAVEPQPEPLAVTPSRFRATNPSGVLLDVAKIDLSRDSLFHLM